MLPLSPLCPAERDRGLITAKRASARERARERERGREREKYRGRGGERKRERESDRLLSIPTSSEKAREK
jgi:hypothetical protein